MKRLRKLLSSLRLRLTLWYVAVLTLILLAFSLLLYHAVRLSQLHEIDLSLMATADMLENRIEEQNGLLILDLPGPDDLPLREEIYVQLQTPQGQILVRSPNLASATLPLPQETLRAALQGQSVWASIRLAPDRPVRLLTRAVLLADSSALGILSVGASLDRVDRDLGRLRFWLLLIVPLTIGLTGLGGVFLADRLLHPLARMITATREISSRHLDRRLPVHNPDDELGRLALTLNELFDRLEAAFANQQRFIADASHELRTPLAAMRAEIEVALRHARRREEYVELVHSVLEEVKRLSRLAERLLLLAQCDAGELPLHFGPVQLDLLGRRALEKLSPLAAEQGVRLRQEGSETVEVWGDAELLEQVVITLMENAVKYTPPGGEVTVSCGFDGDRGRLEVRDTGPGIPAEHLPHIFERFYRVDETRSRQLGGSGLGLAIARSLVEVHGGEIEVESEVGRGSAFRVLLPPVPPASENSSNHPPH